MEQGMKFFNIVICAVLLAACTANDDLYDPAKAEALLKTQYKDNFVKSFGEVAPDYSWDASSAYPMYGAVTRAEVNYEPEEGEYYEVPSETLGWLRSQLPEGKNNRRKGTPFIMTVPDNKFTIIPIYQGNGSLDWELHMVVGNEDILLWKKYEGIQVQRQDEWVDLEKASTILGLGRHTENDRSVKGRRYTFDLAGLTGQTMYFYLEITSQSLWYNPKGTKLSSLDHMMLALDCPCPSQEFEGKEVMVVGCEDNEGKDGIIFEHDSDWDMNDLVFMIVGDKVPDPIDIEERQLVESVTKRYMIEDLGSTCDFDFNDIVVDVTQERIKHIEVMNGVISNTYYDDAPPTQKAVIRHLGGVLPFSLKIGNTDLGEMEGQLGVNPDSEHPISGWKPEQNNITVQVGNGKSDVPYTVVFPKDGEIPMIIAVDPDVPWMEERISITEVWFESIRK